MFYKQWPPFGPKMCSDICPRTLPIMSFEQIMSKDKYASKFSRLMEATVFIILQMFFATCSGLKFGEYNTDYEASFPRL